ncbi:MAG: hypothetical protein HFH87_14925 [Lachnospiraceae bacterium]|nr:hypothetical protein [Lachnospiraceae bacterium]
MDSMNKIRDAFDCIKAGEELKASTRDFIYAARRKEQNHTDSREKFGRGKSVFDTYPVFRRALGAVCAVLLMFLGAGGYALLLEPVAYVSIDVNPSLELVLNRFDFVISATAYNEDGELVLENVSLKGKSYTDAIDLLVESDVMQPYLAGNSALTFTVAADNSRKEERLLSGINNCSGCRRHGGVSFSTDISTVNTAHESGLSLGKYAAYSILSGYDDSITTEDCHNMTMGEIHGLIESHQHGDGAGHGDEHERENHEIWTETGDPTENDTGNAVENTDTPIYENEKPSGNSGGHGEEHGQGHGSGHGHGHGGR